MTHAEVVEKVKAMVKAVENSVRPIMTKYIPEPTSGDGTWHVDVDAANELLRAVDALPADWSEKLSGPQRPASAGEGRNR